MNRNGPLRFRTSLIAVILASLALNAPAREVPNPLPRPDTKAADTTKPIKIFILAGQSNMLEMGTIHANDPGTTEDFFPNAEPTAGEQKKCVNAAVYKGAWSPDTDYDKATPEVTGLVEMGEPRMMRVKRRSREIPMVPFPDLSQQDGHTTVVRGYISVPRTGAYKFQPGLEENRLGVFNMTTVEGKEVYRRDPGQDAAKSSTIDLEAGKRYAFKTIYFEKPYPEFTIPMVSMPGTLETMAASDPRYAYLKDDKGEWIKRNDVFFLDVQPMVNPNKGKGNFLQVPTKPGGGGIGLELAFGSVMGTCFDEPVLLIRSACGNRGLWYDFRPPSRGEWEKDKDGKYTWQGAEYRYITEGVAWTLENLKDVLPGYKGQGYELAGFVWFQGHKDTLNAEAAAEYEQNLVALIKDLRKDLGKPKLPVMIGTVGFNGDKMSGNTLVVHAAQMAVGDARKHPEFAGTVKTVDTRPFWRSVEQSPGDEGHHYNRNAETYMLVGDALARGMIELLEKQK
ncbi:MAG: hypothetical protein NTW21_02420 [Verrucomicrobia bacterium]|nr:hypothetical protein [Verrucomicrobiota bacterium]